MLKASSLLYAIFVCLIVSLLSGSLVLIFNYQYRLKQQYFLENEILTTNQNHQQKLLSDLNLGQLESSGLLQDETTSFATEYQIKKWGFYDLLQTQTYFKKDTIAKVSLIGNTVQKEKLALYLSDLDKPLHVGGKTKIKGNVKISKYGVKPGYISNKNYIGSQLIYGKIGVSEKKLPQLVHIDTKLLEEEPNELFLEGVETTKIYHSFQQPPLVLNMNGIVNLENISISGNVIIKSTDSICVKKSAALNNVLIDAKSVTFEDDFVGVTQVFATNHVSLGKRSQLKYPSSIYINNDTDETIISIFLETESKLAGGIVLTGDSYQSSLNRLITIEEKAILMGDVYCYGKTQLKGKVIGTIYTDRFYLKTASAIYENYIIDGEINCSELPENFIGLPLFQNKNTNYEVITEL